MTAGAITAASLGLSSCHSCGLVSRLAPPAYESRCARCDAVLHVRKPNSIGRTWALIIAALVLYIPANVLPVTITRSLFGVQSDTIMSGVAYFWNTGSYDLAIIIFTASIFVPLAKLLALSLLTLLAQRRIRWEPQQCTRLYRMVEFIGKWSMLDVFVVALLSTLVDFSALAAISAGPGAVAFGSVVVITMFAAMTFDPRLLWEPVDESAKDAAHA